MKVLIFENEYDSVKGAFEAANLISFNNELEIKVSTSSQNVDFKLINDYNIIFIDIDLSTRSFLDGYALIKRLQSDYPSISSKIVILTGNNKIKDGLDSHLVDYSKIHIIVKPTDYEEISKIINKVTMTKPT